MINEIGERGFMTLVGIRQTTGSINYVPPSKESLVNNFKQLFSMEINKKTNKLKSNLTTGAKALSKHTVRSNEVYVFIKIGLLA